MALRHEEPQVLVVAGADSSGGAGIARDIQTLSMLGLSPCLAITAVTVQTDKAVTHVEVMPAALVGDQMRASLEGGQVQAVKLGMLATPEIIREACLVLADHSSLPVVVDPVLVSSSGRQLMAEEGLSAYRQLFPLATLLTPNLLELATLTGDDPAGTEEQAVDQARFLIDLGMQCVLVKGGHATGHEAVDLLVGPNGLVRYVAPRLGATMRGTGCTLATAIAAGIALGRTVPESVHEAKSFVFRRLCSIEGDIQE